MDGQPTKPQMLEADIPKKSFDGVSRAPSAADSVTGPGKGRMRFSLV